MLLVWLWFLAHVVTEDWTDEDPHMCESWTGVHSTDGRHWPIRSRSMCLGGMGGWMEGGGSGCLQALVYSFRILGSTIGLASMCGYSTYV